MKKGGKGPVIAITACVCAAAVLIGGYLGLCTWAGWHILPNSSVGGVEIGGLSRTEAAERLASIAGNCRGKTVNLTYGQVSIPCDLDRAGLTFDDASALGQLSAWEESFLRRGAVWLGALIGGEKRETEGALIFQNQDYVDDLMDQVAASLDQPVVQHQIEVEESYILLKRGQAGMAVDTQAVETALLERLSNDDLSDFEVDARITEPEELDFEALRQQIDTEPQNAALDPLTFEITPSVTGKSFDPATAQALFERTEPGESCRIPLILTEPEITTEKLQASLFSDMLGEAVSTVSGSSGRKSNVKLAGQLVNETILLPGEEFSYWSKIAPCTREQGFLPAPTYLDGKTVDGIGGGVCQVSSSIYYACLYANLQIVQRNQHTYAVGYLPNGGDAMVSSGTSDFKFKNNTEYPIKITANVENSKLTVQIWGTKTDDTYVKMEFNNTSSTPYETVYKIDDSVPAGSTKVESTGYKGYTNETYRCIYAGDGTLISRTLESRNNYRKRDKIVLINSADAALYGLAAPGETPAPEVTPTPEATPAPEVPSVPDVTPTPEAPSTPEATPSPEVPTVPEATPVPEVPSLPEATPMPEIPPAPEEGA